MAKKKNEDIKKETEIETEEVIAEEAPEPEVIEEKEEKDEKEILIDKLKDQLLRQAAEYDNYRKRTAKERMELEPEIISKIVTQFLPVLDNLERALANECTDPNYKKGVEMIAESFILSMQNLGVEEIKTEGEMFNPTYHQAVQQVPSDELESGKIASTFQKGYKIGEKILRFSMVAVVS